MTGPCHIIPCNRMCIPVTWGEIKYHYSKPAPRKTKKLTDEVINRYMYAYIYICVHINIEIYIYIYISLLSLFLLLLLCLIIIIYIYMYIHIMFLYPSKSTQLLRCSGNVALRKRHHPLVASGAPHARCH